MYRLFPEAYSQNHFPAPQKKEERAHNEILFLFLAGIMVLAGLCMYFEVPLVLYWQSGIEGIRHAIHSFLSINLDHYFLDMAANNNRGRFW